MPDHQALSLLVRKLNNHVQLNESDAAALLNLPHTLRTLDAASYIIREGARPGPCAILLEGFAFRQKLSDDGARQITSIHIPGDALDLQHMFLNCADHNVQALTQVQLAMIPRAAMREIAISSPTVAHAFAVNNQVEASIAREWLLNIGRRDGRKRLAHLLCEVGIRLHEQELVGEAEYDLPMSQEQLGDATGMTAVHVNRMLMLLEKEGLISRRRRSIRVPDWERLKHEAGFTSNYLHLGQQSAAT